MTLPRPLALGFAAILYGAAALGANPAGAEALDADERAAIEAMRDGDMRKLILHEAPRAPLTGVFVDEAGNRLTMAAFAGRMVVLNFWATWCPPCRAEMPSLDRLAAEMSDEGVSVVALSTDRGGVKKVRAFYDQIGIQTLGIYNDARGKIPREAGVLGLPVTVILDGEGQELARLTGEAEWDAPEAIAIIRALRDAAMPKGGVFQRAPGSKAPGSQAGTATRGDGVVAAPE